MALSHHPRTWRGIIRQRNYFEVMVNDAIAMFMRKGIEPTKRQVCDALGLDYDNADDRSKVSLAIAWHKKLVDYAWNLWVESGDYDRHYQQVADDILSYRGWKAQKADLYGIMKQLGMTETDIHQVWILSQLWERFLQAANKWNLHVFVAFGQPFRRDGFRYRQPNYWDYIYKQIEIARKLCKGTLTILERHRDLGMILTSAEPVEIAIQTAKDTLEMVANGPPLRHRCELCAREGRIVAFRTQTELVAHYKERHEM